MRYRALTGQTDEQTNKQTGQRKNSGSLYLSLKPKSKTLV